MGNRSFPAVIAVAILACLAGTARADDDSAAEREFTLKVLPVLKAKCFACHGDDPKEIKGSFDVRTREGLLKGGDSNEPSIVPGKPEESPLYLAVTWEELEMPPKENDRLPSDQVELIRRWIAAGAPWPDEAAQKTYREAEWTVESTADGVIVKTSGGLADEWTYRRYKPEDIWSFRPVVKPKVPPLGGAGNPIDAFLEAKRAGSGIEAAPQAGPLTLIRRASYDLIGLPPTPAEIESFQVDWAKDADRAWTDLIDRLLASPHYGERWGRHWLDVARYADTGGYSNDYERSNAWRYRDYVIRSFNVDKPYDRFIVEQIAGDELADASVRQRSNGDEQRVKQARLKGDYTPEESEGIVATSFLRMGPWDNAMVKSSEARQIYLDDVVNSVGQTFLSTTMRCLKCHDHKFDPIPTRDYYRMYAAFAGTQMAERPAPFLDEEIRDGFDDGKRFVERMLAFAVQEKTTIETKQEDAARKWYEEHDLKYVPKAARMKLPDEQKPPRNVGLDHTDEGQLKVREQDEWIWKRNLERYQPLAQSVYNGPDLDYSWDNARYLRIRGEANAKWRPQSTIYTGGSLEAPGLPVGPGVLSAPGVPVADDSASDPYILPEDLEGRRLGLARWIANPRNPLTTRSIVNRIWQHHFGLPIARNPNNFGAKGAKPTHPELLDWLAADFAEHGWTMKRLHRLIMTSRGYRQSSHHPAMDDLRTKDPENNLLAYFPPRRLTAEELRDSLLLVTGELNPKVGGLPAIPEINMEVALQPRMIQFSLAPAYQPSPTRAERNRRSIYAYKVRGQADPFMELFNLPTPNDSCEQRDTATVSPQVFSLLNSDMITDRSIAFARRLRDEGGDLSRNVEEAFLRTLGRRPNDAERDRMTAYVRTMQTYHEGVTPPKVTYPTRIRRSLVEEFSGKTFEYDEILPVFENYEADIKPGEVEAGTRALADLCLLLFNTNDFIYIY